MPSLHQLHVGSLADVVIDKSVKIAHSCCHVSKWVVIICTGNPALVIPFFNHLGGFELAIKRLSSKSQFTTGSVSPDTLNAGRSENGIPSAVKHVLPQKKQSPKSGCLKITVTETLADN